MIVEISILCSEYFVLELSIYLLQVCSLSLQCANRKKRSSFYVIFILPSCLAVLFYSIHPYLNKGAFRVRYLNTKLKNFLKAQQRTFFILHGQKSETANIVIVVIKQTDCYPCCNRSIEVYSLKSVKHL